MSKCDRHLDTELIDGCVQCGAPVCCPKCCDEAIKELDSLLSKGIKSIGWDFSKNIEQAKKEGHKNIELLEEYAQKIENCANFYWTSFFQYQTFCQHFPSIVKKKHYCGSGKTYDAFKTKGIPVLPITDIKEYLL